MTFLAPWALLVGALAAAGLVALHLVARQRPAAYALPTARFVPDRRALVTRLSRRPRDLLLLLLRVLVVLSAAVAFARPVLTPRRSPRARVLLLDQSAAVADRGEVVKRARELVRDGVATRVMTFDSVAVTLGDGLAAVDSLERLSRLRTDAVGSLSAALVGARRAGGDVGLHADSVELALVSPLTVRELDAATDAIRATWPGGIRVVRVAAAFDSSAPLPLERGIGDADVLGPALGGRRVERTARALRLLRGVPTATDTAFARQGGVVVRWDSIGARPLAAAAVAMGDDVVVASLGRDSLRADGVVLARWADGSPAAVERALGRGCLRDVSVGVPVAGDLPLSRAFQRIANGLTDACVGERAAAGTPADSSRLARLSGPAHAAHGAELATGDERAAPLTPWLLGFALACALAELLVRYSREPDAAPEPA